jgi:TPR repeat protein
LLSGARPPIVEIFSVKLDHLSAALVVSGCLVLGASAFAQADPKSETIAGIAAYNRADYEKAFRLLTDAASKGGADAQVNLGYMYVRGEEATKNDGEALRLRTLSANQGNGEGMNALGYKYAFGSGVPADPKKAVYWFCRAISVGDVRAMNNLADLYEQANGVPHDHGEAVRLWQQASERGDPNAMVNLAQDLEKLKTNEGDAQARSWYVRAGKLGQPGAIGWLRVEGYKGTLPDPIDTVGAMELAPNDTTPGTAKAGVMS